MNPHASPEEQKIIAEAAEVPTMLDEKKLLEERRRRLEVSLQEHVEELKDRGQRAGMLALAGAGALLGVWLVAKAVGSVSSGRKHKKDRALKTKVKMSALGPRTQGGAARDEAQQHHDYSYDAPPTKGRYPGSPPPRPATAPPRQEYEQQYQQQYQQQEQQYQQQAPPRMKAPQEPAGPSMLQTFMESEAGRMMTNQLVALLMVFVTTRLEGLLKIQRGADIGNVKESDLTPYRIVDPVSDATVIDDDDARPRPNAPTPPSATTT